MLESKIVQVSAISRKEESAFGFYTRIYVIALCENGSLWIKGKDEHDWKKF